MYARSMLSLVMKQHLGLLPLTIKCSFSLYALLNVKAVQLSLLFTQTA
jgi:hypothetical protein